MSSKTITFHIANGRLVCEPGQAGRAAIQGLARVLGMDATNITAPGVDRTECTMTVQEYERRLAKMRQS